MTRQQRPPPATSSRQRRSAARNPAAPHATGPAIASVAATPDPPPTAAAHPTAPPASASHHPPSRTSVIEVLRRPIESVLTAGIAVMNEPVGHGMATVVAAPQRHLQRRGDHGGVLHARCVPADDRAGEAVDHERHVDEPGPRSAVGEVGDPFPVRRLGGEVPIEQVWRSPTVLAAERGPVPAAADDTGQALGAHESVDGAGGDLVAAQTYRVTFDVPMFGDEHWSTMPLLWLAPKKWATRTACRSLVLGTVSSDPAASAVVRPMSPVCAPMVWQLRSQRPTDEFLHDLVGSAVDLLYPCRGVHLGDRVLHHVAVAAEDL